MSQFNGKKLTMATLHEPAFVEGIGSIESTIIHTRTGSKVLEIRKSLNLSLH